MNAYYGAAPPMQLLYGDGPGIFSVNGTDISAIIDWGGVRAGSVADDIGCWTAHGATDRIPLPAYTAAFLEGYRRSNDLLAVDASAVPLFQRLRIASRACYVTDPGALAGVKAWWRTAWWSCLSHASGAGGPSRSHLLPAMSRNTATRPYGSVRGEVTNSTPAATMRS